jgi:DNA-binding NarL/FixJ family response regulator
MQHALIVEDLPEIRDWLAEVARAAFPEVEVTTAARVDQALARVAERPFDLALIDLGLPDGSGIDVVGALRHHQPRAVPVVVTIYDDDDHLFPALQAGAFGYLLKEQPQETLIAQLLRMTQGEPPLSPPIARRVLSHFARRRPSSARCAPSCWPTTWARPRRASSWRSSSAPQASAARRSTTCCCSARRAWARPRSATSSPPSWA